MTAAAAIELIVAGTILVALECAVARALFIAASMLLACQLG